jgi:tRNA U34 5-carboxymethylaminomethyl modifying GTPase MnmE/TrmE
MYERINDIVMGFLYSPVLLASAYFEVRTAREIRTNRSRGDEDDDIIEEWEQMDGQVDFEADGWNKRVESAKSNLEEEQAVVEIRKLKEEVETLKTMIEGLTKILATESNGGPSSVK